MKKKDLFVVFEPGTMIPTRQRIAAVLGLSVMASVCLSALTNAAACAGANAAPKVSKAIAPAGHINPNPSAGPGNAVPAKTYGASASNPEEAAANYTGIYIPVPEARNVTFVYISKGPVALLDGAALMDETENVLDERPVLKTVGPVLLESGLLIGQEGRERLRLNDAIRNGAIQNVGDHMVDLPLSDGEIVRLRPGQAIYVNDNISAGGPTQRTIAIATHHWECACTCKVSETTEGPVSWNCSNCGNEGNQCKASEGNTCRLNENDSQTGTLENCGESLEPNSILPAP